MTDCLVVQLQENIPSLFVAALFWVFFFVELRHLLAFRAGRASASAVIKWQYVNTLLIFITLYLGALFFIKARPLVYIPGQSDCEAALIRSGVIWIASFIFLASFWGLTLVSYAACAVVEDETCRILMPVLVLRTLVTGFLTWLFIVGLT